MATVNKKLKNGDSYTASAAGSSDVTNITTAGATGNVSVADGTNSYTLTSKTDARTYTGGKGNDTFVIGVNKLAGVTIDGGTSDTDTATGFTARTGSGTFVSYTGVYSPTSAQIAAGTVDKTDARISVAGRPGAATSFNQSTSVLNLVVADTIKFNVSGDYTTGLSFTNIEKLQLANGVQIKLLGSQLKTDFGTLDKGAINPGLQIYGTAGGKAESVIAYMWSDGVALADDDGDDEPVGLVNPAVGRSYYSADLQLDDFTIGDVLHDVTLVYQAHMGTGMQANSYARFDGSNNGINSNGTSNNNGFEVGYGCEGSDYATMRLGDDTFYGYGGNDRIDGHGGADKLYGGAGNDVFTVGSFGSGTPGTSSKSDDGLAEWVSGDLIDGGAGIDALFVTTGIGATNSTTGTLTLTDANFKNMEKVNVGAYISKDPDESQYQYQADEHWLLDKHGTVANTATSAGGLSGNSISNVVIDATGVTKKGLTFEGNADIQTFKGTTQADVFIGNEGNDVLWGNGGADLFVYQTVRTYARDSSSANGVISYTFTDTPFTGTDTINDFVTGTDKIQFRVEASTTLEDTFDSLVALTKGNLTTTNVQIGDIASGTIDTSGTNTSYIKADTTGSDVNVYYDADGSGAGAAILICTLVGVSSVVAADFSLAAVSNF